MAYWLMKSEPDVYGIHHLETEGVNMWEGCRNFTVRNYLKDEMSIGDLAFFYHSNIPPVGIVGVMKIVSEAYPDPTQFDPESKYYDAKSNPERPRWYVRDVEFVERFPRVVTLAEIKAHPVLSESAVARRGNRLSITKVTPKEWEAVMALKSVPPPEEQV